MLAPAQLLNVWLASVRFEENFDFPFEDRGSVYYDVEPNVEVEDFHRAEDENETHAIIRIDVEVNWYLDEASDDAVQGVPDRRVAEKVPFTLNLGLRGFFEWDSASVEENAARRWLDLNALFLLWPYVRAQASEITAMSRLPKLTLYTLTVPETPDFDSEEDVRSNQELPRG